MYEVPTPPRGPDPGTAAQAEDALSVYRAVVGRTPLLDSVLADGVINAERHQATLCKLSHDIYASDADAANSILAALHTEPLTAGLLEDAQTTAEHMLNTPDEYAVWLEERAAEAEESGFLLQATMIRTLTIVDFIDEDNKRLEFLAARQTRHTGQLSRNARREIDRIKRLAASLRRVIAPHVSNQRPARTRRTNRRGTRVTRRGGLATASGSGSGSDPEPPRPQPARPAPGVLLDELGVSA